VPSCAGGGARETAMDQGVLELLAVAAVDEATSAARADAPQARALHALRWHLTRELARPGGVSRLRTLAQRLPDAARLDFSRFVNALLPRLLAAWRPGLVALPTAALHEAWHDELVVRRWQCVVQQLDATALGALLAATRLAPAPPRDNRRPDVRKPRWPSTSSTTMFRSSRPVPGSPTAPA
jgi:hypothetical protein